MEGFDRVERIDPLETLTAEQRELLDDAIRDHPELASETLVVYRLEDGRALVAPQTEAISIGDPLFCSGSWTESHSSVVLSDEGSWRDAEVSVAPAVADATPFLKAIE